MALEHRIADKDGRRLNYTCGNNRFETDIKTGFAHGRCLAGVHLRAHCALGKMATPFGLSTLPISGTRKINATG